MSHQPAQARKRTRTPLLLALCLTAPLIAQSNPRSDPEWTTSSHSPARDGWQTIDSTIAPQSAVFSPKTAGKLHLLWKTKLDNKTMGMQSFREPLIISKVHVGNDYKTVTFLAGAANDVFALDAANGDVLWKKKLKWESAKPEEPGEGRGFICTNAQSATPVVTPYGPQERRLYVLASDGYLHTISLASGEEPEEPIQVLPLPYGKPYGLNLVDGVIYTITGQGCGGVPNALYAVNLKTRKVTQSTPPQAGLWGVAGPAIGSDGTIYFESGDGPYDASTGRLSTSVEAFTFRNDTLTLKDYFSPSNHEWLTRRDLDMNSSPVVFYYKDRDYLVASGKEGRFFLLDTKSLGGANHETPLYRSALVSNTNMNFQTEGTWGSLTSWQADNGTRWVLAPTGGKVAVSFPVTDGPTPNGGIIALKVTEDHGKPELAPAWTSHDMMTAEPPVVVNGVILALAGGEFTGQADDTKGGLYSSEERIKLSVPAKLYALDALTGKELFNSGAQIGSFLHQAGLSVAGDKVIFGTFDGTVYCFGL